MVKKQNWGVRLAQTSDRDELARMFGNYQRTIAAYEPSIDPDLEFEAVWLEKPGQLFPYLILQDERAVGFLLLYGKAYTEAVGEVGDMSVYAMYVGPELRGTGFAEWGLREILALHAGACSVPVLTRNLPAMGFWKRVLGDARYGLKMDPPNASFVTFRISTTQSQPM